jgi:hypothetical protein
LSKFTLSQKGVRIGFGLALAGLILAVGWWDLNYLDGFHWDTDEGTALMQVRMLQQGYALYREVWSDHPPGLMLSILAAFRLAGSSVAVGRAVVGGFSLLGLLAVASSCAASTDGWAHWRPWRCWPWRPTSSG